MGRRPNAIVSEYFVRGEKLADASNRYSHTCRQCGEVFPKGRVDRLTSHLLKRCPSISQDDRQVIYKAIQQQPKDARCRTQTSEPPPTIPSAIPPSPSPPAMPAVPADVPASPPAKLVDYTTDLPESFLTTRDQGRLHTLAEASVIAGGDPPEQPPFDDGSVGITAQDFISQLQTAANPQAFPNGPAPEAVMYLNDGTVQITHAANTAVSAALAPSPLVHVTSAANEDSQQFGTQNQDQGGDFIQYRGAPTYQSWQQQFPQADTSTGGTSWGPTNASNNMTFGSLTTTMRVNGSTDGTNMLQTTARNRTRGRFDDSRRKEVKEIRKEGACMRCRMLKKPCSTGTPCATCNAVESARLWKGACVRARLADQFTLWSTRLLHAKAKIDLPGAIRGLEEQKMEGRIEVRLFPRSNLAMTFRAAKYKSPLVKYRAPSATETNNSGDASPPDVWLLDDSEGISSTIGQYVSSIADVCIAEEQSVFLKSTLQRAQDMVRQEQDDGYDALRSQTGRSSYTLGPELLKEVVELWVATTMLTLRNLSHIQARYNPGESPSTEPTTAQWANQQSRNYTSVSPQSRGLLFTQILAAIEYRCIGLAKSVMNEMERRLLQRGSASRFATVISSTILLNCVERMTGAYRHFDETPSSQEFSGNASNSVSVPEAPHRPADWPLDTPPRTLWLQGERFADLLIMLLRTRDLPPRTTVTADGKLIASQDPTRVISINRSVKEQTQDVTKLPAAWLNHLGLKQRDLVKIRDEKFPSHEKGPDAWDMKFITRLLLDESVK